MWRCVCVCVCVDICLCLYTSMVIHYQNIKRVTCSQSRVRIPAEDGPKITDVGVLCNLEWKTKINRPKRHCSELRCELKSKLKTTVCGELDPEILQRRRHKLGNFWFLVRLWTRNWISQIVNPIPFGSFRVLLRFFSPFKFMNFYDHYLTTLQHQKSTNLMDFYIGQV